MQIFNMLKTRIGQLRPGYAGNSDALGATGAALAQQEIHSCAKVASKMGIWSVAASSSWRTHSESASATSVDEPSRLSAISYTSVRLLAE